MLNKALFLFAFLFAFSPKISGQEKKNEKCSDLVSSETQIECCSKTLKINQLDVECNFILGVSLFKDNKYIEAIPYLDNVISIDSLNIAALECRSDSYKSLNNYEKAYQDIATIKKYFSSKSEIQPLLLEKSGILNMLRKNYLEAYEDYSQLNKFLIDEGMSPNPTNYIGMAKALWAMNKRVECIKMYNKAIEIDKSANSYFDRALFYIEEDKINFAIDDLNSSLSKTDLFPEIFFNLGILYSRIGNDMLFLEIYRKGIAMFPEFSNFYEALGFYYFDRKEYQSAILFFNKLKIKFPESPKGYFGLGITEYNIDKIEEGCVNLEKALTLGDSRAKQIIESRCKNRK